MRTLSESEINKLRVLTSYQVSLTLIEPTETGLKKSIMDATGSVRSYLKENLIHDYDQQKQGPEYKVVIKTNIYCDSKVIHSEASLYRPVTKHGDPRIWFSGLSKYANPNDIIGIFFYNNTFNVFNLSQLDIGSIEDLTTSSPLNELIKEISRSANQTAFELLTLLKKVAIMGPIPSLVDADTSVGRTLETALGININSSKKPDYKGIELKSFRSNRSNRKNLFAQVPDWSISKFKSSAEILDAFGYQRGLDFKLYCTVSTKTRNSQGLTLRMDSEIKQLIENSLKPEVGDFIVWKLENLHNRLQEKHKETFWVQAESTIIDNKEFFQYSFVEHTKKPISSQFDLLIDQGIITVDHLIKRNINSKVVEKGPLFKIRPKGIDLLFPPSEKYQLI